MKEAAQWTLFIGACALVIYVASRCAERPDKDFRRMLRQSGVVKRVK